jgi:carbon storage regulator
MLLLTRKPKEIITIGDDIEVHVMTTGDAGVLIGITAPKDVQIHRKEVYVKRKKLLNKMKELNLIKND